MVLLYWSYKLETNDTLFSKIDSLSERGRVDQFIFLKMVDKIEKPN
jgi:hypothetical protein